MSQWGAERFAEDATALGFQPIIEGNLVHWAYEVPIGARASETIDLGFDVPTDWPDTSPHGPHVRPAIEHPGGNNHDSPFGPEWRHWSRPFNGWGQAERTLANYLAHVRGLFCQL